MGRSSQSTSAGSFRIGLCMVPLTIALAACSTNPRIASGASIRDFARAFNGSKFDFDLSGQIKVPAMSGALVTAQRIPEGLLVALAPAKEHCAREGGALTFTKLQNAGRANLPVRIECGSVSGLSWAVDLAYLDSAIVAGEDAMGRKTLTYLKFTVRSEYLSAADLAARIAAEQAQADARARADAERQERQARDAAVKAAEAERQASEWPGRVAAFRSAMKSGDRCEWRPATQVPVGPLVGVVVRTEGALAYVQFENATIGGQTARYVPKTELLPFDRPTPTARFEIK